MVWFFPASCIAGALVHELPKKTVSISATSSYEIHKETLVAFKILLQVILVIFWPRILLLFALLVLLVVRKGKEFWRLNSLRKDKLAKDGENVP